MKLVIDIPQKLYTEIKDSWSIELGTKEIAKLKKSIANGKPLPKGHGRIGDLNALQEEVSSWGMNDYEPSDFIDAINKADTIIEADEEEGD